MSLWNGLVFRVVYGFVETKNSPLLEIKVSYLTQEVLARPFDAKGSNTNFR
jgi:hypothetical protein